MAKFKPGDKAWIVESTIFVVEVEIVKYSGGFYLIDIQRKVANIK